MRPLALLCLAGSLLGAPGVPAAAQTSQFALRFHGTGVGPPGQQDRILLAVDDNEPGSAGNTPLDIGASSFTIEWWMRGLVADNDTSNNGGDVERFDYSWIEGNIIFDRDIWCGSERAYGVSLRGGLVNFGTGSGDLPPIDPANTIEGSVNVLDGGWHHVAVVRDASAGVKHIYVDGALDFSSSTAISFTDLSYPDAGIPVTPDQCGPGQLTPYGWFLVVAAEKHDAGPEYPSYNGYVDELRVWTTARSAAEIAATYDRLVAPDALGLVGMYRFETGFGTEVFDESAAGGPVGDLRAGVMGNGEWVAWADDPANTAPIDGNGLIFADGFESGDLTAWSAAVP